MICVTKRKQDVIWIYDCQAARAYRVTLSFVGLHCSHGRLMNSRSSAPGSGPSALPLGSQAALAEGLLCHLPLLRQTLELTCYQKMPAATQSFGSSRAWHRDIRSRQT